MPGACIVAHHMFDNIFSFI
uniref:Uncharacterized protein n=1 Tax=Arundo donax TaxID=35708 RepID=A0A0A9C4I8_ARUDO